MIRLLAVAIAVAAFSLMTSSSAQAQGYHNGYQFGAGVRANCGRGLGFAINNFQPREQLPYFAKFPPVYYSHIVKRPYGVSPYAAPAGIAPVEMSYPAADPVVVKNPFFGKDIPVKAPANENLKKTDNKTTTILNPYVENLVKK